MCGASLYPWLLVLLVWLLVKEIVRLRFPIMAIEISVIRIVVIRIVVVGVCVKMKVKQS